MNPPAIDLPFVTVIMPVFNEEVFIDYSLRAVLNQEYPTEQMEVLVVDGHSTDQTRAIVDRICREDPRVRLLDNPDRDQASALNVGIAEARGQIIVRVDGHCYIPQSYVPTCVRVIKETGAQNVGGQMRTAGSSSLTRAIALATSSPFGTGGARFHSSGPPGDVETVYLGAFQREVFEQVGGFDRSAVPNEDYEMNIRIRAAGGRVYYTPELWAWYSVRPSLAELARQYFRYGWRKAFIIRRYPRSTRLRQLATPAFVAVLVSSLLIGAFYPTSLWVSWGILIAYGLVISVVSLILSVRHGWRNLVFLPVIFPILHLSWGIGLWTGVIAQLSGRER